MAEGVHVAADLAAALSRLGLQSVAGLSDQNMDDDEALHALQEGLDSIGPTEVLAILSQAITLAENLQIVSVASADAQNIMWGELQARGVDLRAFSAFIHHVTKVILPTCPANDACPESDVLGAGAIERRQSFSTQGRRRRRRRRRQCESSTCRGSTLLRSLAAVGGQV
jgi:hypothetical protein